MGFFRRRHEPAADAFEPPPDIDVPEGMVAVPDEKIMDWASQLSDEASEMATGRPAPQFVDLAAKVGLLQLYGERVAAFPRGSQLLGYNVFLLGYWCRAAELQSLEATEVSAPIAEYLEVTHDRAVWGDDWFQTLIGASVALAGMADGMEDIVRAFRSAMPEDLGDEFRRYYAGVATYSMCGAIDEQHPGSSDVLTPAEWQKCWEVGYWMRAVAISLPDAAHVELAGQ